jgi:glutamyl-tRNA(Gln) amidotransferase subunit E
MQKQFDPAANYEKTKKEVGYLPRHQTTQTTYDELGFMSGLEVHQQLNTKEKLFCRCPNGLYNQDHEYDAELIRHMRPTLSELGEYDGTALMEFKTRKEIIYRIKDETACTYEVDDTPPFPLNKEALEQAIIVSFASKLNIVGEVHITRKQYLDGSIPTGFQRTAIIGIEGEIYPKNKKVRLIQLSLEEDSCREISDIGHTRIFKTDRLGIPLIETVTYPDMKNPDDVKDTCDYIRFLNRSTGLVRTGIGAGRQDVNVSCTGGTRVEIKGVARTKSIPELTHIEVFRQWARLKIKEKLNQKISDSKNWKITSQEINFTDLTHNYEPLKKAQKKHYKLLALNLPGGKGILSHFTQPSRTFADEISGRLKIIACLGKPNLTHSEDLNPIISELEFTKIATQLNAKPEDAQILLWAPADDVATALETIEERCQMAFSGIPPETRKSLADGTTIFERVLPGADRMYPDTDSPPIPLDNNYVESLKKRIPSEVIDRYNQLQKWDIPEDTYTYILSKNLYPLIAQIITELNLNPKFTGTLFGHTLKNIEGKLKKCSDFTYQHIYDLCKFIQTQNLNPEIIKHMLSANYQNSKTNFETILKNIHFKPFNLEELKKEITVLKEKFTKIKRSNDPSVDHHWLMGQIRAKALGNIALKDLKKITEGVSVNGGV